MRGKRKGRGGRRVPQAASELPSDSPKRKDSRLEFHGHLSHASPPITNFFQPQSKSLCSSDDSQLLAEALLFAEATLAEANYQPEIETCGLEDDVVTNSSEAGSSLNNHLLHPKPEAVGADDELTERSQSPATPHKILMQEAPQSSVTPSSALSQLSIANGNLKKTSKSRRKLNPSQTANQLVLTTGLKPNFCPKTKASSVSVTKATVVTSSSNGSQPKLTEYFPVRRSERKTKKTVLEERQRTLEEAVLLCKEEGLQIHNFEGKGRGIVANRLFSKGEFVVEYAGELIKMDEARDREKLYAQDQNTGCYMYYFKYHNQQYCVDATPESKRLGRLVNHSRNGNLLTKTITIDNIPRLVLIAKEDILPGDEVTYDYGDRSKESLKFHPWLAS